MKRETDEVLNIGGKNVPIVMADFCQKEKITSVKIISIILIFVGVVGLKLV